MHVFLFLSEWSSCNCFSPEPLEATQRNRIETTFAFEMSWDGEEGGGGERGGRAALLPSIEQLHLPFFSLLSIPPSSHPLSPSLHLIPSSSPHSQHASPCIVFPESSKVGGRLLIRAGYCKLSAAMDELICVREECARSRARCAYACVLRLMSVYV